MLFYLHKVPVQHERAIVLSYAITKSMYTLYSRAYPVGCLLTKLSYTASRLNSYIQEPYSINNSESGHYIHDQL